MNRSVESHECDFKEEYYGFRCSVCGQFYAFGCAPWDIEADDERDPDAGVND